MPAILKTLRDKMPLLSEIDLSGISIMAYTGIEGTVSITIAYPADAIPQNAFNNYNSTTGKKLLNRIILPQNLLAIGSSAFAYCTGLSSVTIPSTVNSIGDYAFRNCTGLSSVNILCSFPPNLNYYYTVFNNVNTSACTLNVPYKSKSQYSVALGWKVPTRGVDLAARERILGLLAETCDRHGTTMVLASTELEDLQRICHRIVVLFEGRVAAVLPPDAPRRAFAMAFAGRRP